MLMAYFDDAGTHRMSDIVVMACVIGSEEEWEGFKRAWEAQQLNPLPGKPQLRKFHMTACMARTEGFEGYSDAERDAVIKVFRDIILAHPLHGRAIAVSRHDWDRLIIGPWRIFFGDAESFCVRDCMDHVLHRAVDNPGDKKVTLIFDDGQEMKRRTLAIAQHKKQWHDGSKEYVAEMFGPSFLSVEKFVPLQAADMFAWETYAYGCGWLAEPTKIIRLHYKRLIESDRFTAGFMDRAKIEQLANLFTEGDVSLPDVKFNSSDV
jgi:hypothetical protein